MPPDDTVVREWLRKADHDLRLARAALADNPPITDGAAFHCQQAVEKLLKGFLVFHGRSFPKIHDLDPLMESCVALDSTLEQFRDRVEPLTAYAVRFRYPGPNDPSVSEVEDAIRVVEQVFEAVLSRLPPQILP